MPRKGFRLLENLIHTQLRFTPTGNERVQLVTKMNRSREQSLRINPQPKLSKWTCYLFGNTPGGRGFVFVPSEDCVPNRFIRFFMKICLGCTWEKSNE